MKITILTPTRDRLAFLRENVRSVRQSRPEPLPLEIGQGIHDCGSADGTWAWLEEQRQDAASPPPRALTLLHSPGPVAPGRARNAIAAATAGELLIPLDDDDLLLQRTCHHFAQALMDPAGPAWAVADFLRIDAQGRYLPGEDYFAWSFADAEEMLRAIFCGRHFLQGNVCFRRELFEAVGGYDADLETAEDLELYVRFLLHAGLPVYVPMVSHLHRMHGGNLSRGIDKDRYNADLARIYEKHRSSLAARGIPLEPIP